jgi:hypothetical protein
MAKKYFIIFISIFIFSTTFAQENVLCPIQSVYVFFDELENIPNATENGDGTYSLTFNQSYITDIFSNYTIYNFERIFSGSSPNALRTFMITYDTNSLIEDLLIQVPEDILLILDSEDSPSSLPTSTPIESNIITALHDKTFNLIKYVNTSDADMCTFTDDCPLNDVPEDFELQITFVYDDTNDLLYAENSALSSCGNTFSIGLKGGYPENGANTNSTLNLWEVTDWTATPSNYAQPCHNTEHTLYSILGIACNSNNYGNIHVEIDSETDNIRFRRVNAVFGYDIIELSQNIAISVEEHKLSEIKIFEKPGNPYLQVSQLDNKKYQAEMISISGQKIKNKTLLENNSIKIDNLTTGLYFIKVTSPDNISSRIIKFLKK